MTARLRALIVDDEYAARAELRYVLSREQNVEITGEAATAREAERLIEALDYDVVFLDIAMPGLSGLDVAHRVKKRPGGPAVIFVTAYDEYALRAFEARALDYLLKPLEPQRIREALDRLRRPRQPAPPARRTQGGPARWVIGTRADSAVPIPTEDVVFVTSEGDQVYIYTARERYHTRHTLRELQIVLPPERFFRCHRGYIVNLSRVREISPFFNGTYTLTVAHGGSLTDVPVARSRVAEMKRLFWPQVDEPSDEPRR